MSSDLERFRRAAELVQGDLRRTTQHGATCGVDDAFRITIRAADQAASADIVSRADADKAWRNDAPEADLQEWHFVDAVANSLQIAIGDLGASWPHCPAHNEQRLSSVAGEWRCYRSWPYHEVASVGSLSPEHQVALAMARRRTDSLVKRLWENRSNPFLLGSQIRLSLDLRPGFGLVVRSFFGDRTRGDSVTLQQILAAWLIALAMTVGPNIRHPFVDLHLRWLPPTAAHLLFAAALALLSATSIDLIVVVPLILAWANTLTQMQAVTLIFAGLGSRMMLTGSFLRLVAPSGLTRMQVNMWAAEHPYHATLRRTFPAVVLVLVLETLPALRRASHEWALRHGADSDAAFAVLCVGVVAAVSGLTVLGRTRLRLGTSRQTDALFIEAFWALFTVLIALVPVALRAPWAPTMLAAIGIPLLVVRWRLTAARRSITEPEVTHWIDERAREATGGG